MSKTFLTFQLSLLFFALLLRVPFSAMQLLSVLVAFTNFGSLALALRQPHQLTQCTDSPFSPGSSKEDEILQYLQEPSHLPAQQKVLRQHRQKVRYSNNGPYHTAQLTSF